MAVSVADEALRRYKIPARVLVVYGLRLNLAVIHLQHLREFRPRIVRLAGSRSLGHNLQLDHALAAVTQRGAHAVGTGVATADYDDILAGSGQILTVLQVGVKQALRVQRQELHRLIDAGQLTAFNLQIASLGRSAAENDCVITGLQLIRRNVSADFGSGNELNAFRRKQVNAPLHFLLVELHVRDAVCQQPADAVGPLIDGHGMTRLVELRRAGHTRRSGADHSHLLARAGKRRLGLDPAHFKSLVYNRLLDRANGNRLAVHANGAGAFAGRRADAACEFREVVRLVQPFQGHFPIVFEDHIIPFRNQIVKRTARSHAGQHTPHMAERRSAVHTARTLLAQLLFAQRHRKFIPILDTLKRVAFAGGYPRIFQKSRSFAHPCHPPC
ncbi:hypothetical protein D3C71_1192150 [compost metagenome]